MKRTLALVLISTASLLGCESLSDTRRSDSETTPSALTSSPSTGPNLLDRYKAIDSELQDSLRKAQRASSTSTR